MNSEAIKTIRRLDVNVYRTNNEPTTVDINWVGDSSVEKDMGEMVEFITDEPTGEFKFTQF